MKTEEEDKVAAARKEERKALSEKTHEAATPCTLRAQKAEEAGAEDEEPPAEAEEEEEDARVERTQETKSPLRKGPGKRTRRNNSERGPGEKASGRAEKDSKHGQDTTM